MYLVTGASGHFGKLALNALLAAQKIPASQIIATTRKPDTLADFAAKGVTVRAADFDDEAGLVKAFAGANRLLLISTDALDRPGRRLEQHTKAVAAAAKAGVKHIVYTSMPNPETSAVAFAPDHLGTEKAIAASTIPGHTILRNNWYMENLFYAIPSALKSGSWYTAAGQGKIAYAARADLAAAAAAALASKETAKKTYTLAGAEGFTADEVAALVAKATGKPLAAVHVPLEAIVQGMVGHGFPEPVAKVFASFDTATARGDLAGTTGDIKALTGRSPQSFATWLAANAVALAA